MKKISYLLFFILSFPVLSQFSWQQLNGPQGGITSMITSNSSGVLFMGSIGGGVLSSTDNGVTWQQKVNGFPSPVFDDGTVAIAIAGDGDIFASSFTDGVYRSTNNGNSWVSTNFPNAFIVSIAIDQSKRIYCGSGGGSGVFVSVNNGLNWVQKNNGLPVPAQVRSLCVAQNVILAGINSAGTITVYRSLDNAESWQATSLTGFLAEGIIQSGSFIFASSFYSGIYRSSNNGLNWSPVNNGLTNLRINRMACLNNVLLAASDSGVFRSSNNGDSWYKTGFDNKTVNSVFITSNGTYLAGVYYDGIYRSTNNGANWFNSSQGYNCSGIISIAFSGNYLFAGTAYSSLMRSSDNGNNWTKLEGGLKGSSCELVYVSPNNYIFAQTDSGLYRSTNSGNNWQILMSSFVSFNAIVNNQNGVLFGAGSYPSFGVLKSTNSGLNWEMTSTSFSASVYSLCITSNGILFAGTAGGGVYRSNNDGASWIQCQPSGSVISLAAAPNGNVYAAFSSVSGGQAGIYRSVNYGVNWELIGLANLDYFTLKINSAGHIYAGGFYGAGLYRSTNYGVNWYQVQNGLYNRMVTTINFDNSGYGYAGTYYGGLYKTNISTIGINVISTEIPEKYSLSQNYPNPFNPQTVIKFTVPKNSHVKLDVFDALGKKVETLVDQNMNPGTFEVTWNAIAYSSGVYFYKIETEGFSETKRMILTK